ncbi:hypothetical protein EYC80_004586 [Monilinia laxa]|uniref:NAD(P)-binding protein n=1 Tax=Monilinia laxa TaxID=61186 RepID=A0A5N6KHH7_MONLA|nr:hypothetical protein EYC80_004586 [Monilinia laxa]
MPPSGLAILIGAGPNTGTGIARILSHPEHGNLAIALLARNKDSLTSTRANLLSASPNSVIEIFPTSTEEQSLTQTFKSIRTHPSFATLPLKLSIFSIKQSSKKPFMTETRDEFVSSLESYVGGAFTFAQESLKLFFEHHGSETLEQTGKKKGTIIFTGTLGALRANSEYAAYGATRSSVRQMAQALAREMSPLGIHVVHAIANGRIEDKDGEDQRIGKLMSADAVGKTYLWLSEQEPVLWTHELDMRPAAEKF